MMVLLNVWPISIILNSVLHSVLFNKTLTRQLGLWGFRADGLRGTLGLRGDIGPQGGHWAHKFEQFEICCVLLQSWANQISVAQSSSLFEADAPASSYTSVFS